jgi:hypothetical protein
MLWCLFYVMQHIISHVVLLQGSTLKLQNICETKEVILQVLCNRVHRN